MRTGPRTQDAEHLHTSFTTAKQDGNRAPLASDPSSPERGGTIVTTLTGRTAEVAERLGAAGVKYAAISFVDMHGKPKAKMVPLDHLDPGGPRIGDVHRGRAGRRAAGRERRRGRAASRSGRSRSSCRSTARVAWFPGDLWIGDTPFEACSRQILKRVTADAATLGYTFNLGIETEFFLLTDDRASPHPASLDDNLDKPCYDLRTMLHNYPVVDEIVSAMNELGWDVYSFDHEDGNGQFETDFTYTERGVHGGPAGVLPHDGRRDRAQARPVRVLDAQAVRRPNRQRRPLQHVAGRRVGINLFADVDDPRGCGLSTLGYQFIAGVLRHADGHLRGDRADGQQLQATGQAGQHVRPDVGPGVRLLRRQQPHEHVAHPEGRRAGRMQGRRQPPTTRTSARALMLAAGLEGIREQLDPGEPEPGQPVRRLTEARPRRARHRLATAVTGRGDRRTRGGPVGAQSVLGDEMFESFVTEKRAEWDGYTAHVSAWETERYLRFW